MLREAKKKFMIRVVGCSLLFLAVVALLGGCVWIREWLNPSQAPVAVIQATHTSGPVPLEILFDASKSYDPGGGQIAGYEWNFGDGRLTQEVLTRHIFRTPGTYLVQLSVTSNTGKIGVSSLRIVAVEVLGGETDVNGLFTFVHAESELGVRTVDESGYPVQGILCEAVALGGNAVMGLHDPHRRFAPQLVAVGTSVHAAWRDGLEPRVLGRIKDRVLHYWDKFKGGSCIEENVYLPGKLTRALLEEHFSFWRGPFKLEYFWSRGRAAEFAALAVADLVIGVALSFIPVAGWVAGPVYESASVGAAITEAAVTSMLADTAAFYVEKGYEFDQQFELWKAKGDPIGFAFIIVPCEAPRRPPGAVTPPKLPGVSVDPPSGPQGTKFSIRFSDWQPRTRLEVVILGSSQASQAFCVETDGGGRATAAVDSATLAPDIYRVQVDDPGRGVSVYATFEVTPRPVQRPNPPRPLEPGSDSAPGSTVPNLTPTFRWEGVANAERYALAISMEPYGPANVIYRNENLTGTSFTLPSGELEHGKKYRWNMQAGNSAGWSEVSSTLYFQTPPPPTTNVTLTLYVHEGSASGPVIAEARVQGRDGAGNLFDQPTNASGFATITGVPGTWSFTVSKSGYRTERWEQDITVTETRRAFLQRDTQNQAPVITSLTADPSTVQVGGQSRLSVSAHDPENDPLTFSWSCGGGLLSSYSGPEDRTWTAPNAVGTYWITVGVTDNKPGRSPVTRSVPIMVTQSPTVDTIPPSVVSTNPVGGDLGAPITDVITATFSEGIQRGTGAVVIVDKDGNNVPIREISVSGRTLTIRLTSRLAYSSGYTVTIEAGAVKDLAGNPNPVHTWAFLTQKPWAPPPPTLVAPQSGATGVSLTPTLQWNPVTGAVGYWVYVTLDSVRVFDRVVPAPTTSVQVSPALEGGRQYFWKVAAMGEGGSMSSWSDVWSFTTQSGASGVPSIMAASALPNAVAPGASTTISYSVSNPTAGIFVLLGASIQLTGGAPLSDPTNDRGVTLAAGSTVVTRPFVVPQAAPPGTYDLLVSLVQDVNSNGRIDSSDRNLDFKIFTGALVVSATAFDFEIQAQQASGSTVRGGSASTTVRAWRTAGSTTRVDFTVAGVPSDVTVSPRTTWSWDLGEQGQTLTFSVGASAPVGTHTIRIRGTGGGVTREATFILTVSETTPAFDFAVEVNPASWTARQNELFSVTVRAWRTSGPTTRVLFSVTGLPPGITASLSGWPLDLGEGSVRLQFSVTPAAPTGTHIISITGTGGGVTRTGSVRITVTGKFKPGDPVYVYGTGGEGLRVRDAPCGNRIGNRPDGSTGVVLQGPEECVLDGTRYRWWKIRWSDGLEGWSPENWLGLALG